MHPLLGRSYRCTELSQTAEMELGFRSILYGNSQNIFNVIDIQIKHSGPLFNIGDWFHSVDTLTIKQGEVYNYNLSEISEGVGAFS